MRIPESKSTAIASRLRRALETGLDFRLETDLDKPFLAALYASTRADEFAVLDWTDEKSAFLNMQFDAQHSHYRNHYPDAEWLIVVADREPVGRLYLERWRSEIRIIDIALLPHWRRRGLGRAILKDLLNVARAESRAVGIHVETVNPAQRLYRRLGFQSVEDKGVYQLMRWSAE